MSGASPLAFPGSRALAGWWRQLASLQPQALWVAHLLLHQVEALVRLSHACRPDPLTYFLLKALALGEAVAGPETASPDAALERLDGRLHLGPQLLRQALRGLEAQALARPNPAGRWTLTPLGREALERQEYPCTREERRTFHFVAGQEAREGPGRPPPFLEVHNSTGIPWPVAEDEAFDPRLLRACLDQPREWKQRHGFPVDVQEIVGVGPETLPASSVQPPPWQRVIMDRPENILAALALVAGEGGQELLGLAVRPEGSVLETDVPLFTLGPSWPEVFPELTRVPGPEAWQQAWVAWCDRNRIPAELAEACRLELEGGRLRVAAPRQLLEQWGPACGEAPQGEVWLLAGEGRFRRATRVELVEMGPRDGG